MTNFYLMSILGNKKMEAVIKLFSIDHVISSFERRGLTLYHCEIPDNIKTVDEFKTYLSTREVNYG